MIHLHDSLDKKLNLLFNSATDLLEAIDKTGQVSPQLVCGEIQKKLENEIASLYYDYSKNQALKRLSEVTNATTFDSINSHVNNNGVNAISSNINIQLPTIASKYEIHLTASIPPIGDSVQCTLSPTSRYQEMCAVKHWCKPDSFHVTIKPFDGDADKIYTAHSCTCSESFTHGHVCKYIGWVLYNIRKVVADACTNNTLRARQFPFEKYFWTRECFYDTNYHSKTLKRQCDIREIPLLDDLREWESLSPMPMLPWELHRRKSTRLAPRFREGAVKRKVEGDEALEFMNNSNLAAGAFTPESVTNDCVTEINPANVDGILQQIHLMAMGDRFRVSRGLVDPPLCSGCFESGHKIPQCPYPQLCKVLESQNEAKKYQSLISNLEDYDWTRYSELDGLVCNPSKQWQILSENDLCTDVVDNGDDDDNGGNSGSNMVISSSSNSSSTTATFDDTSSPGSHHDEDNDVDFDGAGAAGEQQPQTVTDSSNIIPSSLPVPQGGGGGQSPPVAHSLVDTRTRSGRIGNGSNGGYRRFSRSPIP